MLKGLSGHLNIDPIIYVKYQNPSLSSCQDTDADTNETSTETPHLWLGDINISYGFDVAERTGVCNRNGNFQCSKSNSGWSGGAMVPVKLPVPRRRTLVMIVGQGPTALAVGAGGGLFGHFYSHLSFSPLPPSLWETARYRLKFCLKGL